MTKDEQDAVITMAQMAGHWIRIRCDHCRLVATSISALAYLEKFTRVTMGCVQCGKELELATLDPNHVSETGDLEGYVQRWMVRLE